MQTILALPMLTWLLPAQLPDYYAYDSNLHIGMCVPDGWQALKEPPPGYPEAGYLFGWFRAAGPSAAKITVVKVELAFEGRGAIPQQDMDVLARGLRGMLEDLGYTVHDESRFSMAGRPAVRLMGGIPSKSGAHDDPAAPMVSWRAFYLDDTTAVVFQLHAAAALYHAVARDFEAAIRTLHSGPRNPAPVQPESTITHEILAEAVARLAPDYNPSAPPNPHVAAQPTERTTPSQPHVTPEFSYLAPQQWRALEEIAKRRGISVERLLREIVDDYIAKASAGGSPQKQAK